jgi:nucleotide-binding universal stress UspA family protein
MKILMCTDGQESAETAIRFGAMFARHLDYQITVLHVRPKLSSPDRVHLTTVRKKLSEWSLDIPEVDHLKRAHAILAEFGVVKPISPSKIEARHAFRESVAGGVEFHPVGHRSDRVHLKLREGDAADEILAEIDKGRHDLTILGSRSHVGIARYFVGSTALRVAEFSPSSVLIAKNIREQQNFLLCTDASPLAEAAEILGAKIAEAMKARVTVLSVSETEQERGVAEERLRRAEMILAQLGVRASTRVRIGRPSEEIIDAARDHDIVVMGASGSSAVRRFFLGSVPLKVIEYGECPVLLVRYREPKHKR